MGGGITSYGATLNVTGCNLESNYGELVGGGIASFYGDVTVTDSTFSYNDSDDGGGAIGTYSGKVAVNNCMVSSNEGEGGGIYNGNGDVTVTDSVLIGNEGNVGGGIYNYNGSLTVSNSLLSDNEARNAGGIFNNRGEVTINNKTSIVRNGYRVGPYAEADFGGIYSEFGTVSILDSDVSGNQGDHVGGIASRESDLTINNSTISGNGAYHEVSISPIFAAETPRHIPHRSGGVGGIYCEFGTLDIKDSSVTNNFGYFVGQDEDDIVPSGARGAQPRLSQYHEGAVGGILSSYNIVTIENSDLSSNYTKSTIIRRRFREERSDVSPRFEPPRNVRFWDVGGMVSTYDDVTISHSSMTANYGEVAGGLFSYYSVIDMTDTTVSQNFGLYGAGGILDAGNTKLSITDSTLSLNGAYTTYGLGTFFGREVGYGGTAGAISSRGNSDITITDSKILLNSMNSRPAGYRPVATGVSARSTLIDRGYSWAGGIYIEQGKLTINGSTVVNNFDATATGIDQNSAGAISAYESVVNINDSNISGNYGEFVGGILNSDGSLTIDKSTLAGNYSKQGVGGVANYGKLKITDSAVIDNGSYYETGGIAHYGGPLTIDGCTLVGNYGETGALLFDYYGAAEIGPLAAYGYSTGTITNTTIAENRALDEGGGIHLRDGQLTLEKCTVADNRASGPVSERGGGISMTGGDLTVTDSTLADNWAGARGGGLFMNSGEATIQNSTISGNYGDRYGGGIFFDGGELDIYNSTIAFNDTNAEGGGVYENGGTINLFSTIVAQNTASGGEPDFSGYASSAAYSLIEDKTGFAYGGPGPVLYANPMLDPLAQNGGPTRTHALQAGSPAINKGDNPLTLATDQRGGLRIIDAAPDIGAFEYGNNPPTATNLDQYHLYPQTAANVDLDDIVVTDFDLGEQITVTLTIADPTTGSLTATTGNGENYDPASGVWEITGDVPQVNAALAAVGFVPNAASPGDTTIAVVVQDAGGAAPLNGTITMDLDAVVPGNVEPVINSLNATPNPTVVGETVTFTVDATDADGDTLAITWDFGDGANGTGASADHAYAAEGSYTVTVTVDDGVNPAVTQTLTVTVGVSDTVAGVGPDSDGDGFSDSLEEFVGTSPTDPGSTPMDIGPIIEAPLTSLRSIRILLKLKPEIVGKDRIRLVADLPVPDGFNFAGKELVVDIGGVQKKFVLDERRRGQDGLTRVTLGRPKFGFARMKLARKFMGDYRDILAATSGLINADVLNEARTIRVTVLWNDQALVANENVPYKAKLNKKGIANKRVNNP